MNKFGQTFISGLVWILITISIGILGLRLSSNNWAIIGPLLEIVGFGFAGLAIWYLFRITYFQIQGIRIISNNPEEFEEAHNQSHLLENNNNQIDILSQEEFESRTLGGRTNRMNLGPYIGQEYHCGCGHTHCLNDRVKVLRELPGMRLVISNPECRYMNCVKIEGLFNRELQTLFSAI